MSTIANRLDDLLESIADDASPRLIDAGANRVYSGREVAGQMRTAHQRLAAMDLRPEATVLFVVRPSLRALAFLTALLGTRCRTVLTDLRLPGELVRSQLDRVGADVLLTEPLISLTAHRPLRRLLSKRASIPPVHDLGRRVATTRPRRGATRSGPRPRPEDEALIVFTSGTTGAPKGVIHTQASLDAMFTASRDLIDDARGNVVYSDQFHSIIPALASGATCVVGSANLSNQAVARAITDHHVDTWFTTPHRARQIGGLLDRNRPLRVVLGSAPVNGHLIAELTAQHPNMYLTGVYAMTEAVPVAVATGSEIARHEGPGDLVGAVVAGIELTVDDRGEIRIRGPRVGRYLDDNGEWIATGDLGYLRDDDRLVLTGRVKDMILTRARNIYPQQFEQFINADPDIEESVLVGIPDKHGDEELWLVVDTDLSSSAVTRRLRRLDAVQSLDIKGVVVSSLPRGHQEKIDRTACREFAARARDLDAGVQGR